MRWLWQGKISSDFVYMIIINLNLFRRQILCAQLAEEHTTAAMTARRNSGMNIPRTVSENNILLNITN